MNNCFSALRQKVRAAAATAWAVFTLVLSFAGCSTPSMHPASATRDHAYIEYWPAANDAKGLRLAVKDLIDMKGVVTTAGSEFLAKNSKPATRDAKCMTIARKRRVHIVGKTNTTELAVAVSGINAYYGTPRNPLGEGRRRIPGGSSCGSAVAVATGTADVAFGTDTAGSIRIPAACCGVAGLKTTFGLVPLDGVYPIAPNQLDTVGPLARDVDGLVQGMDLLQAGFAGKYRQTVATSPAAAKLRIGRLYLKGTNKNIDRAIDAALAATGFDVVKLDDRFREHWLAAEKDAATVAATSAWIYDLKILDTSQVTARTKAVIAVGELAYRTGDYQEAVRRQPRWQAVLREVFASVDFIALPTMDSEPPRLPFFGGTLAFELRVLAMQNTAAVNFGRVPALALPVPLRSRSFPVTSLQLIGPMRSEAALLNAGRLVEAANSSQGS
jgi:Asp-tRNA(Asn)/Glu-tRNA(Gln) amidotransferase A subunit family amidase